MPTTPKYQLPYPLGTDPADAPAHLKALADRADGAIGDVATLVSTQIGNGVKVRAGTYQISMPAGLASANGYISFSGLGFTVVPTVILSQGSAPGGSHRIAVRPNGPSAAGCPVNLTTVDGANVTGVIAMSINWIAVGV